MGNLNNVLRAPARPATPPKRAPAPVQVSSDKKGPEPEAALAAPGSQKAAPILNGIVETAKQAVVNMVEALAPDTTATPVESPVAEVRIMFPRVSSSSPDTCTPQDVYPCTGCCC